MKTKLLVGLCLLFGFSSCLKSPEEGGGAGGGTGGSYFDYATVKSSTVNISYGVNYKLEFQVFSENPLNIYGQLDVNKTPLFRGFTNENGVFSGKIPFPIAVTNVYVYTSAPGVNDADRLLYSTINNLSNFTPVAAASPAKLMAASRAGTYTFRGSFLDSIAGSFVEGQDLEIAHPEFFDGSYSNVITTSATDSASVSVAFISRQGTFHNKIGYYTYPAGTTYTPNQAQEDNQVIFANTTAVSVGQMVDLRYWDGSKWCAKFPANTCIGFYMIQDADNCYNLGTPRFRTTDSGYKQLVVLKAGDMRIVACEDLKPGQGPWADGDHNDAIFGVIITPDPVNDNPPIDGPEEETVLNFSGTMYFEDLWPYEGDYDVNDVVVEFSSKVYVNKDNKVTRVEDEWKPIFKGAGPGYYDAFGYQYGVVGGEIKSLTWNTTSPLGAPTAYSVTANCMENNQTYATVMLFDDVRSFPGGQFVINGNPTYTVNTEFNSPQLLEKVTPPYNSFIVIKAGAEYTAGSPTDLRKEVHFAGQKPTDLANPRWFGYGHDRTDPSKGRFYVNQGDMPWAIYIPVKGFVNSDEKKRLDVMYPDFSKWVNSGGTQYKSWYLNKAQ